MAVENWFDGGELGWYIDPAAPGVCFQDVAGTIPAGVGDVVRRINAWHGTAHITMPTGAGWTLAVDGSGRKYCDTGGAPSVMNGAAVNYGTGSFDHLVTFATNATANDKFILGWRSDWSAHLTTGGYASAEGVMRLAGLSSTILSTARLDDGNIHTCRVGRSGTTLHAYLDESDGGTAPESGSVNILAGKPLHFVNDYDGLSNALSARFYRSLAISRLTTAEERAEWDDLAAPSLYSYNATPNRTTAAPSQAVTVNVATTGVADGTTLYWTESGTATGDDIDPLSGDFTITSDAGSFDIDIKPGATAGRTIIIQIRTGSTGGTVVDTAETVTITLPSIAPDQPDVDEGDTATWTVTGPDGSYKYALNTTLSDADTADIDLIGVGTVVVSGGTGTVSIGIVEDFTTDGAQDLVIDLLDSSGAVVLDTAAAVTINDTSNTVGVDFTITASDTSVNEGDTITLTATSSVMPPGGKLYYAVSGGANNADFDFGQGEIVMSPSGGGAVGSVDVVVALDESSEGVETCTFKLRTGGVSGPDVATTATITISDTSIPAASYYLLMGDDDVEGGTEPGTLFVNWVPTGTTFYWEIAADSYMVEDDFVGGVMSGTFSNAGTLAESTGAFAVYPAADLLTEVHPGDTGTATSATATSLTDTTQDWAIDQQANKLCVIIAGTGTGERNLVAGNAETSLAFAEAWGVTPDNTSVYRLEEWFRVLVYQGSDNTGELVADSGIVWIEDTSLTPPTFSVSVSAYLVPEGGSIDVDAVATNFPGGTLWYTLVGTANGADYRRGLRLLQRCRNRLPRKNRLRYYLGCPRRNHRGPGILHGPHPRHQRRAVGGQRRPHLHRR